MKPVNWSTEKNIRLKAERGVSFEEVLSAMSNGGLLVVLDCPNTDQYPNQRMFVVRFVAMHIWCRLWKRNKRSS